MEREKNFERWNSGVITLHWLIAGLVLLLIALGWMAVNWPLTPLKFKLFIWHKSVGLTVLVLALIRIGWRLGVGRRPEPARSLSAFRRRVASIVHVLFYVILVAMPLSGWIINSAGDFPFRVYYLFNLPAIVSPDPDLQVFAETVHFYLFVMLVVLIVLHVGAALHHHFIVRNDVLRSMLPRMRQRTRG